MGAELKRLHSIQALRGVAAVSVVIFHSRMDTTIGFGAAGVDLFFVISGFIMARISQGRSAGEFMADRIWRIFPLYLLCAATYSALAPVSRSVCREIVSASLLPIGCEPYLAPAWTLTYELLFYFVVALTIGRPRLTCAVLFALVLFAPNISTRGSNLLLVEFVFGMGIAALPSHEKAGLPILALGAFLLLAAPTNAGDMADAPWRVALWGVPAALIVYGALSLERHFSRKAWLVRLGDASYSIYLVHYILYMTLPEIWWPVQSALWIAAGIVVHQWIERPLMRLPQLLGTRGRVGTV